MSGIFYGRKDDMFWSLYINKKYGVTYVYSDEKNTIRSAKGAILSRLIRNQGNNLPDMSFEFLSNFDMQLIQRFNVDMDEVLYLAHQHFKRNDITYNTFIIKVNQIVNEMICAQSVKSNATYQPTDSEVRCLSTFCKVCECISLSLNDLPIQAAYQGTLSKHQFDTLLITVRKRMCFGFNKHFGLSIFCDINKLYLLLDKGATSIELADWLRTNFNFDLNIDEYLSREPYMSKQMYPLYQYKGVFEDASIEYSLSTFINSHRLRDYIASNKEKYINDAKKMVQKSCSEKGFKVPLKDLTVISLQFVPRTAVIHIIVRIAPQRVSTKRKSIA